jgi:carboxyl-terminal processing protease
MLSRKMKGCAALSLLAGVLLTACGGGGSGSESTAEPAATSPVVTTDPVAATSSPAAPADTIESSALVANFCAAPRTGIDPFSGRPYPDKPGTVAQEKSWVRAWIDETYLWFDEIPSTVRAANYATPQAFFDALRTPALTPSGKPRDQFHFMYPTSTWQALTKSGIEAGYGFEVAILKPQPPRDVRVAYVEPGTAAARAGITRGVKIVAVDGVDVENAARVDVLNSALFPSSAGQGHIFKLQELDGSVRLVTLSSANIAKMPVQNVKTIDTGTGKVGYMLFNDHVAPSEAQLIAAMARFKADGVQDLVLDIRYNGGGLLAIASELAYMIATPAATTGTFFEKLQFNGKNPFRLTEAETVTPFYSTSVGFSTTPGQALPQLGLSRVTVLTGPDTCSASEAIINGLRGVGVQVTQIGNTTCGKPYGFLPQDNCGTTYFAVQFKGVNNQGFGDYGDGMAPTCPVADDFSRPLGDPAEARLAAALSYRATGVCPAATMSLAKAGVPGIGEALVSGKSPARMGRFLQPGALSPR